MVKIRLARIRTKNQPKYRIVAADEKFKRDGRFLEILGHYDPTVDPFIIKIDDGRFNYWLSVGAQPTDSVKKLLVRHERIGQLNS